MIRLRPTDNPQWRAVTPGIATWLTKWRGCWPYATAKSISRRGAPVLRAREMLRSISQPPPQDPRLGTLVRHRPRDSAEMPSGNSPVAAACRAESPSDHRQRCCLEPVHEGPGLSLAPHLDPPRHGNSRPRRGRMRHRDLPRYFGSSRSNHDGFRRAELPALDRVEARPPQPSIPVLGRRAWIPERRQGRQGSLAR